MKDPVALASPGEAWAAALDRSRTGLFVTDLVEIPKTAAAGAGRKVPGVRDVRAAGATEIARGIKRTIRPPKGSVDTPPPLPDQNDSRIRVEYVGFTGQRNLGDDAMLEAIRRLMPWAEIGVQMADPSVVMLGGGTLFNADRYYLNKVKRVDGPSMERIVFGTGFRGDTYWDATERYPDWEPFLGSALSIGVRGPDSLAALRAWGLEGSVSVIGDPALSLLKPDGVERVEGKVVLCPVHTGGQCWGDDHAVFDQFASTVARLKSQGRDVVMMTAHPADDRWAIDIMRRAGHPDLGYVAGYDNLDETLRLLASADLVIGERLHAVVLAAAMGTPFVAVEYRPKLLDFARSIDSEQWVVRTDQMDRLDSTVDAALDGLAGIRHHLGAHVEPLVALQHRKAGAIASALEVKIDGSSTP